MPEKITIVIVEDHKLIREMWGRIFTGNIKFQVTGESEGLDEAIEIIKINRPDIVFLDINLAQGME